MSDIHYDTRTGAVMAGGLSGTGKAKPSAATKKRLADLRAACPEAMQKSNQELILLLENYNDQMDMVTEALRTGEAEGVVGGWATTAAKKAKNGKNKKASESDTGRDNASEASSNKHRVQPQAASASQSGQAKPMVNGSSGNTNQSSAQSQQNQNQQPKASKKPSNISVVENGDSAQTQQTQQQQQPQVKDASIGDIHSHAGSFARFFVDLEESHMDDVKNLDFAFEQIRTLVERRYATLRRSLDRAMEQATETLRRRHRHGTELSERIASPTALSPKEYAQWQQDVATFISDYKYDIHLATVQRFTHATDGLQKALNQLGNVSNVLPTYSYTVIELPPPRPVEPVHAPQGPSQPGPARQQAQPQNAQSSRSSNRNENQQRNNQNQNSTSSNRNSNDNNSNSRGNNNNTSSRGNNNNTSSRGNNNNSSRGNNNTQQQQQQQFQQQQFRERVTIVPKDNNNTGGYAPMESLVISGGNLTAEELANLTSSLQNMQFGSGMMGNGGGNGQTNVRAVGSGGGEFAGDFADNNVFNGGVWTNSNAGGANTTSYGDQWNQGPSFDQQNQGFQNQGFDGAPGGGGNFSQSSSYDNSQQQPNYDNNGSQQHFGNFTPRNNGAPPVRGGLGMRGARRGNGGGRGQSNGRGGNGRGPYRGNNRGRGNSNQ